MSNRLTNWQKAEIAEIKQKRKLVEASLEFSKVFEPLRKKHKLTRGETIALLQEQTDVYLTPLLKLKRND